MPDPARSIAKAPSPSAEVYDRLRQVEMNAQKDSSDLSSHEDICAERYAGIEKALAEIKGSVTTLNGKVDVIALAQITAAGKAEGAAEARKPKWWVGPAATLAVVVLSGAMGAFGWMASRIASDTDRQIEQSRQRPAAEAATVNVNPPVPAVAPPPTPAIPAPPG